MEGPGTNPDPFFYKDSRWGVRVVASADYLFFHVDCPIDGVDEGFDDILPWADIAEKHTPLFLFGDYAGVPTSWVGKPVFKQSCPNRDWAVAFFHPVVIEREPKPILECRYRSGFQGTLKTHCCRQELSQVCDNFRVTEWWSRGKDYDELRASYLDQMEDTKFAFCPRGRGLNSIRFFEALRMGRIPVLIADDAKLPLEWIIDYNSFVVRVPEHDVISAKSHIQRWLEDHDIVDASLEARRVSWEYFEDPEKFIDIHKEQGRVS
jgi:hypothetical protein